MNTFYGRQRGTDIVIGLDGLKGFEVKWGGRVEAKRLIMGKMRQLVFLSRDIFGGKPLVVPVSAFLACLDLDV